MTQTLITELFSRRVTHTLSKVVSPNQHLTFTQLKIYYADKDFDTSSEFFLKNLGLYTEDEDSTTRPTSCRTTTATQ